MTCLFLPYTCLSTWSVKDDLSALVSALLLRMCLWHAWSDVCWLFYCFFDCLSAKCKFHIWPTYSTPNQSYVGYNTLQWFQHCNCRMDYHSSLQASIYQCPRPMEWMHALKPMKSKLLAWRYIPGVGICKDLEYVRHIPDICLTYDTIRIPEAILKYASISKYFEVLRYQSFFDIEVQHFDIEVQHFDIEATKKASRSKFQLLRYRSCMLRYRSCMLRYRVSKSKGFNTEVYVLRHRYLNTLISKHLYWI